MSYASLTFGSRLSQDEDWDASASWAEGYDNYSHYLVATLVPEPEPEPEPAERYQPVCAVPVVPEPEPLPEPEPDMTRADCGCYTGCDACDDEGFCVGTHLWSEELDLHGYCSECEHCAGRAGRCGCPIIVPEPAPEPEPSPEPEPEPEPPAGGIWTWNVTQINGTNATNATELVPVTPPPLAVVPPPPPVEPEPEPNTWVEEGVAGDWICQNASGVIHARLVADVDIDSIPVDFYDRFKADLAALLGLPPGRATTTDGIYCRISVEATFSGSFILAFSIAPEVDVDLHCEE